jgi:UDP-N-acetylglucosamine 2-epimerase (non-hydrolysing)
LHNNGSDWTSQAPARSEGRAARRHGSPVMVIAGTRPETIKLAPVIHAFLHRPGPRPVVVNSGQHPHAVHRSLEEFGLQADCTLPPVHAAGNLSTAVRQLERNIRSAVQHHRPRFVLVQGDTSTAYAGARAAAAQGCSVAHIEAGLRTAYAAEPFPEEWFRRRITSHADIHFVPTAASRANLLAEGVDPAAVYLVGNTGIDSLRRVLEEVRGEAARAPGDPHRVAVTLHRRENWDENADVICDALLDLSAQRPDLTFFLPVHPNPRIARRIARKLGAHPCFSLVEPMRYREFVKLAARSALIVSDSGGIQEEAPHLGVPLLVPRSCTERPEALATGFVRLVDVCRQSIVRESLDLLAQPRREPVPFGPQAPFGDGFAALRIVEVIEALAAEPLAA